jgi:hypothetical protein
MPGMFENKSNASLWEGSMEKRFCRRGKMNGVDEKCG